MPTRREFIRSALAVSAALAGRAIGRAESSAAPKRVFDVRSFGAVGDGRTLDRDPIQKAIDAAAAAGGARVLVPGGRQYLIGALHLRSGIELHLADDAELLVSANPADFGGAAALNAIDATDLRITGTGTIDGRAREFMERYDATNEWWVPKPFRPRLAVLAGCKRLEIGDVTFHDAPSWTLHLLGCEQVLIDRVKIRNRMDVPNCDGIDPDHCRDVEIRGCEIACGDDAIVIKTTRGGARYGPSARIHVHDCVLETQDSGLKIGTETTQDITNVRFERCRVKTGSRGLCIQLRDEGNVSDVEFRDIAFESRYFSDPWWGRGEGISFTALPRTADTRVGALSDIRVVNVTGRAENSTRIEGCAQSRVRGVRFEKVALTLDRWTKYHGGVWDNRPTSATVPLEEHATPAIAVRYADDVMFRQCRVGWGAQPPAYFTNALEAENVSGLDFSGLDGPAARPELPPVVVRERAAKRG